jgi:hypothetical protein
MQTTITPEQRQAAKREIIRQIEQGAAAKLARVHSAVPMHRTTVYRLRVSGAARRGERLHRRAARAPGQAAWRGTYVFD